VRSILLLRSKRVLSSRSHSTTGCCSIFGWSSPPTAHKQAMVGNDRPLFALLLFSTTPLFVCPSPACEFRRSARRTALESTTHARSDAMPTNQSSRGIIAFSFSTGRVTRAGPVKCEQIRRGLCLIATLERDGWNPNFLTRERTSEVRVEARLPGKRELCRAS